MVVEAVIMEMTMGSLALDVAAVSGIREMDAVPVQEEMSAVLIRPVFVPDLILEEPAVTIRDIRRVLLPATDRDTMPDITLDTRKAAGTVPRQQV